MTPRQRSTRARHAALHRAMRDRLEAPAGIGPARGAALIAALSPRTSWRLNLEAASAAARAARRLRADGIFCDDDDALEAAVWHATESHGLSDPRRKAARILAGGRPDAILGGSKVRAFWRNLSGDERAVTVDVWAARAALGHWLPSPSFSPRTYERIARAYQAAADRIGIPPRELQATIWIDIRGAAD